MASATPDLTLPSQPTFPANLHSITAPCPVPNYTGWWQRHVCVNTLPRVVTWKWIGAGSQTRDLLIGVIASRTVERLNHSPSCHTTWDYNYEAHLFSSWLNLTLMSCWNRLLIIMQCARTYLYCFRSDRAISCIPRWCRTNETAA